MSYLLRWRWRWGRGLEQWISTPSAGCTVPASRLCELQWCCGFTALAEQMLNLKASLQETKCFLCSVKRRESDERKEWLQESNKEASWGRRHWRLFGKHQISAECQVWRNDRLNCRKQFQGFSSSVGHGFFKNKSKAILGLSCFNCPSGQLKWQCIPEATDTALSQPLNSEHHRELHTADRRRSSTVSFINSQDGNR